MPIQSRHRAVVVPCTLLGLSPLIAFLPTDPISQATFALPDGESPLAVQAQVGAEDDTPQTAEERREKQRQIAEERRKEREAQQAKDLDAAMVLYTEFETAYLNNEIDKVQELYKRLRTKQRHLPREKQMAVRHMNQMVPGYRPKWWDGTKKQEKNSFKAEIWGRNFWANYVPSRELGLQAVYPQEKLNSRTGQYEVVDLIILVTWKPLMVDSDEAAGGKLSEMHGYTLGDIAEVIVWHELGHNYMTEAISTKDNVTLYQNYSDLYSTLHEHFADLAAIYHGTPRARKVALQFRLEGLDYYTKDSSHCRGSHGIGSILIADMLSNPDKWPSVRFPPAIPEQQIEINTIIYIYENLPAMWTAEEDIRVQELAEKYVMKHGKRTFKSKGEFTLPSKQKFALMYGDDRENQSSRDEWVRGKLEELISEGRADKLAEGETYNPPERDKDRGGDFRSITIVDGEVVEEDTSPPRIEVPWDY